MQQGNGWKIAIAEKELNRPFGITGTAMFPSRYVEGVTTDGGATVSYVEQIKLDAGGSDTSETVTTYRDMLGRQYKTIYGDGATATSYYNGLGQQSSRVDPDGVTKLLFYNLKGEQVTNVLDVNQNGSIDWSGPDRITFVTNDVVADNGTNVHRTRTFVWSVASNTSNLISTLESSVEGLKRWNVRWNNGVGITNFSQTVYAAGGYRYETNQAADGTFSVSTYQYGKLLSVVRKDAGGIQISQTSYGYDAHGRQSAITDARNGTTTYGFDNDDNVISVTTPMPGGLAGAPETTASYYDSMGRIAGTLQPDNTTVTNLYYLTGRLKRTYGSRICPVGYGYDAQGRMTKMTNWTSFAGSTGARVTTWNYDSQRGWLNSKQYDDGNGPSYSHTAAARLQSRTWVRGTNTAYAYNGAGDLQTVIYNDSFTSGITNGYDRLGRLTTISNGPTVCTLTYNDVGLVLTESYAGGTLDLFSITNGYDVILRRTNNVLLHNGTVLAVSTNSFDASSRLSFISDGTNSATYSYLANSSLVSQVVFKQSGTTRMTTSNQYDYLNRLISKTSGNGLSYSYQYNQANQRTEAILSDGRHWNYGYDSLGQVTSGKQYWSDWTPVAGEQFEYGFDDIGNRTSTAAGGDASGSESRLRSATYLVNDLNQYTNRTVPGAVDILGDAWATASVTVNGNSVYRKGEFYDYALSVANSSGPVWQSVTNKAVSGGTTNMVVGNIYVPTNSESFTYDADGNLTTDGRWSFVWDAENRLVQLLPLTNDPAASKRRLTFGYDYKGRRMSKQAENWDTNSSAWSTVLSDKFAYDGWNLLADLNGTNSTVICAYMWGTDLSGTSQGAGGAGGLLKVTYVGSTTTNCFVAFDGNGNAGGLIDASTGAILTQYEYGPFGEVIRATGPMSNANPFGFSTKYQDSETGFLYYGYRFYDYSTGRCLGRDPIEENGGNNLYELFRDDAVNNIDNLGLDIVINKNTMNIGLTKCEVVILFGHGREREHWTWKMSPYCNAGASIMCWPQANSHGIPDTADLFPQKPDPDGVVEWEQEKPSPDNPAIGNFTKLPLANVLFDSVYGNILPAAKNICLNHCCAQVRVRFIWRTRAADITLIENPRNKDTQYKGKNVIQDYTLNCTNGAITLIKH